MVAAGAWHSYRWSIPARQGLAVAMRARSPAATASPARTRAEGCCQVPQKMSAPESIGSSVHASPTAFLPIAVCAAGFCAAKDFT